MLEMHANNREEIKEARAGDIVALCGLKARFHELEQTNENTYEERCCQSAKNIFFFFKSHKQFLAASK